MKRFSLDRMRVRNGRMTLELSWPCDLRIDTTPRIVEAVLEHYPRITSHSCINSYGPSFGDVIAHTNLAHLIEHIVIEEQHSLLRQMRPELYRDQSRLMLVGTTEVRRDLCRAVVEVSFVDDIVCAQAVVSALDFVESCL